MIRLLVLPVLVALCSAVPVREAENNAVKGDFNLGPNFPFDYRGFPFNYRYDQTPKQVAPQYHAPQQQHYDPSHFAHFQKQFQHHFPGFPYYQHQAAGTYNHVPQYQTYQQPAYPTYQAPKQQYQAPIKHDGVRLTYLGKFSGKNNIFCFVT